MNPLNHKCVLLTIVFAMVAICPICRAQTDEPGAENQELGSQTQNLSIGSALEMARANAQADRATIVNVAMKLSDKDATAFWPIYRQYEYERSTLEDRRVVVIKEYAQRYPNLTDDEAKMMAETMFDYDSRLATLKKTYYKKFNKVLPALTVTKFFQLDRRIDLLMDMQVESSLPPLTSAQFSGPAQ
jgi:hypothetical protein